MEKCDYVLEIKREVFVIFEAAKTFSFGAFFFQGTYTDMVRSRDNRDKREQLEKDKQSAGLVADRFPGVSGIVVRMKYYQKLLISPVLMVRTVHFYPDGYAYFNMACMTKECVDGGFDLTPAITSLVKHHKRSGTGKMICKGDGNSLSDGHASIFYEINVQYNERSRSQ